MKLKYYLRGLGIGMIVTALILGISFSHRQGQETQTLTDDQIRERAEQLGMVDSSELTLAALQNSVQQQAQENTEKTEASPEPETEEAMTTTSEPETTVAPENTMEPEATPQPETIVASEAAQTVTATTSRRTRRISNTRGSGPIRTASRPRDSRRSSAAVSTRA